MHLVYLLTGSNEGDRKKSLDAAVHHLEEGAGKILLRSPCYETAAWGLEGLPMHLNQALLLETALNPEALLQLIHLIENKQGRIRQQRWGVRSLDIDIIYFDHLVWDSPDLVIPHPLMTQRRFVLQPLCAIAPDFQHPVLHLSNKELLAACTDHLPVSIAAS